MAAIAIVLARGGSKRLPGKNLLDFNGRPMLAWTVEAALNSGVFTRVVVSTDSESIANVALKYGAEVLFLRNSASMTMHLLVKLRLCSYQAENHWQEDYSYVAR